MDHVVFDDRFLAWSSTSHKLQSVSELLHALAVRKKLVEGEHLVKLVNELVRLGFLDQPSGRLTAQLESAFLSKSVLWSIDHGQLRLGKLLGQQKIDLERLDEAVDHKSSDRGVTRAR